MCDPFFIGTGLTLATAAYTTYEQDQTVKGQNKFNAQQAKEGAELANASYVNQAHLATLRTSQEAEAASQELTQNATKAAQARATARVSAGESGVSGVSVDNLIGDFNRQEAIFSGSVNRNLQLGQEQTQEELKGLRTNAQDRGLSFQRAPIERPSYLAAGIGVAGQTNDLYNRYRYTSAK